MSLSHEEQLLSLKLKLKELMNDLLSQRVECRRLAGEWKEIDERISVMFETYGKAAMTHYRVISSLLNGPDVEAGSTQSSVPPPDQRSSGLKKILSKEQLRKRVLSRARRNRMIEESHPSMTRHGD